MKITIPVAEILGVFGEKYDLSVYICRKRKGRFPN